VVINPAGIRPRDKDAGAGEGYLPAPALFICAAAMPATMRHC
jgi:hypothetical protein